MTNQTPAPVFVTGTYFQGGPGVTFQFHANPSTQCAQWQQHRPGGTCRSCQVQFPAAGYKKW